MEGEDYTVNICSDFDSDCTESNFNSYWKNWDSEEFASFTKKVIYDDEMDINGHTCFYKVTKFSKPFYEDAMWRFSLIFDKDQEKVCIVSGYDFDTYSIYGPDDYMKEILHSIRFK